MDAVEEIKSRLSIEDIVGRHVDLKKSGASFKGLCPFHGEKTPSFYVTPSRGTFHCFGCGKGGDIFAFLMELEKQPFPEVLKELAEQAGVSLPERERTSPSLKSRLYEANEAAARFFAGALSTTGGERARQYLDGRRFDREATALFGLGWAPDGREGMTQHLRAEGFDDRILLAAGLAIQDETTGRLRDRFRGRLMFPIRDAAGKISGFGGRILGDGQPKYLNSPQTEIFDKSAVLYGIHLGGDAIRREGKVVLVEGYLDALRAHRNGFGWTVASLGTAVTVQQLLALSRLTSTVILALDPDPAGQAAAARTALTALAEVTRAKGRSAGSAAALDLRIARLPEGAGDPDELIRDRPALWEETLAASIPAFDFYFQQTMASVDRSSDMWQQDAIDRLLPVIQQFSTAAAWQAKWIERLAAEAGIDPRALGRTLPSAAPATKRSRSPAAPKGTQVAVHTTTSRALTLDPAIHMEEELLALLLKVVVTPREASELLDGVALERPEHAALLAALLAWSERENYDIEMFRETLPEDLGELTDRLITKDVPMPDEGKTSVAVAFYLARLRQFRTRAQLDRTRQLLTDVEPSSRGEAMESLLRLTGELRDIDQTLAGLSKAVSQSSSGTSPSYSGGGREG